MLENIWYIGCYLCFFAGLTLYKKRDKKLNLVRHLVFNFIGLMIANAMIAAVLYVFKAENVPFLVGLICGVIGVGLICVSIKRRAAQKYYFDKIDFAAFCVVTLVVIVISLKFFTPHLYLSYGNSDPAVHFYYANSNLATGIHTGMFFAEINNAIFMNCMSGLVSDQFFYYKLYILVDIAMFALSGFMAYVLMSSPVRKRGRKLLCAILAVVYILGYSLNNLIFGFCYLGVSVTLIGFIVCACNALWNKKIKFKEYTLIMSTATLSLSLCYMLFAPIIWTLVAIFTLCYLKKSRGQKICSWQSFVVLLKIFLVPAILTLKFCYFDYLVGRGVAIGKQFNQNGGIYTSYFLDLVIYLPIVIYAAYYNIKNKKEFPIMLFSIGWAGFVLICNALRLCSIMSPYYCAKTYFVLWLIIFVMFANGLDTILDDKKRRKISLLYLAILMIFPLNLATVNNEQLNKLVGIHAYNLSWVRQHDYINQGTLSGYIFAYEEIVKKNERITWLTSLHLYHRVFWFDAISLVDPTEEYAYYRSWQYDAEQFVDILTEKEIEYAGIFRSAPDSYEAYMEIIAGKPVVYENGDVVIYRLINLD